MDSGDPTSKKARARSDPAAADFRLDHYPFYHLNRVAGRYNHLIELGLKRIGSDIPHWRVLMILHEQNPCSISEIAERGVMKMPTVTKMAQRMQTEGLVTLSPRASDGRVTEVFLTPQGEAAVEDVRAAAGGIFKSAFGDFTAAEVRQFNGLMRRLFDNLETPAPKTKSRRGKLA